MKIITFAQAGKFDGIGHLKRSLVIKNMLDSDLKVENYFYVLLDSSDKVFLKSFKVRTISNNLEVIKEKIREIAPNLIIIDFNYKNLNFKISDLLIFINFLNIRIIVIDGLIEYVEQIDLIFLPSFFPSVMNHYSLNKIISGWDCYLLEQKFFMPNKWLDGNNLLVMTGGSDLLNLGKKWPKYINEKVQIDLNLHWIVGPYAQKPEFNFKKNINFFTYLNPNNIPDICKNMNYAITVYGVSFFELIALGIPTIVIPLNDNRDKEELDYISKNNIALTADDYIEATYKLIELKKNNDLSKNLVETCNKLFSRPGVERLKFEIRKLLDL